MSALGTWNWVQETGGKLGRLDRLRLVGQGVRAKASARLAGKADEYVRYREIGTLAPPDTPLAIAAEAVCREASAPWLYDHCLRAWYWGRLLDDGRAPFDEEAVWVAFLLHDLGLTDTHRLHGDQIQCFTEPGAREAERLCREHGWSDARAYLAANAISLHLNVIVGAEHGREAQIMRTGAGADIVGQNVKRIPVDQRNIVLQRHPRQDFKHQISQVMLRETNERPCCRMAFLYGKLGFNGMIARAPFDS